MGAHGGLDSGSIAAGSKGSALVEKEFTRELRYSRRRISHW